jgi:3-oxoacyl-(acyl-carrier-protein) synthase
MTRPVVITGLGVVSPIGIGADAFWEALRSGRSGVSRVTAFEASPFPCQVAAEVAEFRAEEFLEARAASRMGRHSQFAVAAATLAVAHAGLELERVDRGRCGAVLGCCFGDQAAVEAEHRVLQAELAGFAASDDAHHVTAPDPEGRGLADAGLQPEAIDYVSAHGTSTPLNDKIETRAIKRAFGDHARAVAVSATKSQVGHLLGAASAVALVATVLAMRHGTVPPTLNLDTPDPECDLDYVPHTARPLEIRAAISNACGFGGQNSVVVVRRHGEP